MPDTHSSVRLYGQLLVAVILCAVLRLARSTSAADAPGSFAYILQADRFAKTQKAVVDALAQCGGDWIILGASFRGDDASRWSKADIQRVRDGKAARKVIAYLSIGEAEDYRLYWKAEWKRDPPDFLLRENPDWLGNYRVRFWSRAWQQIILADVDKLVAQGCDGLYLDKVDIYEDFEFDPASKVWIDNRPNPATGHTYREDMIAWVQAITSRSRSENSHCSEECEVPAGRRILLANN